MTSLEEIASLKPFRASNGEKIFALFSSGMEGCLMEKLSNFS
jgi:hypothetical protein